MADAPGGDALSKFRTRWMATDSEVEQTAAQPRSKRLEREYQRSVPSESNLEGPRAVEADKAAMRAFPGNALQLQGAAVGRREFARISGSDDDDSQSPNSWTSIGPRKAIYPVATSRTNAEYVTSGRVTALAIDPRCAINDARDSRDEDDRRCRLFVGAAGGGSGAPTGPLRRSRDGSSRPTSSRPTRSARSRSIRAIRT